MKRIWHVRSDAVVIRPIRPTGLAAVRSRRVERIVDRAKETRLRYRVIDDGIRAVRNTLLDPYENIPRSVVVTANDYAAGTTFPEHAHGRGQFAFASRGTISVSTPHGRWLVPPQRVLGAGRRAARNDDDRAGHDAQHVRVRRRRAGGGPARTVRCVWRIGAAAATDRRCDRLAGPVRRRRARGQADGAAGRGNRDDAAPVAACAAAGRRTAGEGVPAPACVAVDRGRSRPGGRGRGRAAARSRGSSVRRRA